METEEEVGSPFAYAHAFGCAYEENGTVYCHGVRGNAGATRFLDVFRSDDLIHWEMQTALMLPEELRIFNTSVCRGACGYVMAVEVDGPSEVIGKPYTILFAQSKDLMHWELIPDAVPYLTERYTACPSIRYADGYYYMVYLERLPFARWIPYIVRTRDFRQFEPGLINPFLTMSPEDKLLFRPEAWSDEARHRVEQAVNCNNSDVDFCEFQKKTVILYSWGNQHGTEYLARAEYDGPLNEFLASFFPSQRNHTI